MHKWQRSSRVIYLRHSLNASGESVRISYVLKWAIRTEDDQFRGSWTLFTVCQVKDVSGVPQGTAKLAMGHAEGDVKTPPLEWADQVIAEWVVKNI